MIIERLELESYGKLKGQSVEFLPGINFIMGDNESGKTTVRHALEAMLHGFGKRPGTHSYKPWSGDVLRISATMVLADGNRIGVRRGLGKNVEGNLNDGMRHTDIGNAPLDFVSHLTPDLHRQLYSLTTEETRSMAHLDMTMLERRLLATFGADELRTTEEVLADLKTAGDKLYRLNGRGNSEIKELKERMAVWNIKLQDAREKRRSYEDMHRKNQQLQRGLSEEKENLRGLEATASELAELLEILMIQDGMAAEDLEGSLDEVELEQKHWEVLREMIGHHDMDREQLRRRLMTFNQKRIAMGLPPLAWGDRGPSTSEIESSASESESSTDDSDSIMTDLDSIMTTLDAFIRSMGRLKSILSDRESARGNDMGRSDVGNGLRLAHGAGALTVLSAVSIAAFFELFPPTPSIIAIVVSVGSFALAEILRIRKGRYREAIFHRELKSICEEAGIAWVPSDGEINEAVMDAAGVKTALEDHTRRSDEIHRLSVGMSSTGVDSTGGPTAVLQFVKIKVSHELERTVRQKYELERRLAGLKASSEKVQHFRDRWGYPPEKSLDFWSAQVGREPDDMDIRGVLAGFQTGLSEKVADKRRIVQDFIVETATLAKELELAELPDLASLEEEAARDALTLKAKIDARDRITILERFIVKQDQRFREMKQPEVLRMAGEYLRETTSGRYDRLTLQEDGALVVSGPRECVPADAVTSTGLKEQIHFALKVALMDAIEKDHEPLPLVIDELFANWDDQRGKNMAACLVKISKRRQILLLSCNERTRRLFEESMEEKELKSNLCSIIMEP